MKPNVLYLFAMLCFAQTMMAQLTSLGLVEESNLSTVDRGGAMTFVPEISFIGDYLYVATPNGLYRYLCKNTNEPSEWEKLPLIDKLVLDFVVRGDTLIALTREQLLISSDGGKTARHISFEELTDNGRWALTGMAVHPHSTMQIYVAGGAKLTHTKDGGATWNEICNDDGSHILMTRMFYNPHNPHQFVGFYNEIYAFNWGSLLFSNDGGSVWKYADGKYTNNNLTEIYKVAFHPTMESRAVTCGSCVYALSEDGGASWSGVFKSDKWEQCVISVTDIIYDSRNPDILYGANWLSGGATTVLRSTDGGYTWEIFFSDTIASKGHVLSLDMKDNILALYTYGNGIYLLDVDSVETQEGKTYLVTEGKQWAVYHNNPLCSKHRSGTTTYRLQGETILYGKTYKKMWVSYKEDLSDMKPFNGYMREENGKVYFANSYEEKLWFDYTAQIGDTLCFKEGSEYGRINNIYEALLSETDSTRSYLCYEMQVGRYNSSKKEVEFVNQYINVYEGLGVIGRDMSYGLCEHYYQSSYDRQCSFTLLCVHNGENILYQTHEGCYRPYGEKPRPTTQRGYGIYYGDSYLYQYIIDESKEVTDSTDFARWHDKTVIYFDVDSVGRDAFANACFRQGQILYFTEKLRYIGQDAFGDILMLDEEPEAKNPFGDLCIVFSGENPPSIDENSIVNYADTTYRITYVVPDLATYIENDMQWTYSQLVTIDDFIAGYVSPENEVVVSDSVGVDLEVGVVDDGADNGITVVYATARPKKDIPVRIGDSNGGDIYSRAPAWMRYTVEIKVTDSKGGTLYTEKKQCSAYEECHFETTLTSFPEDGIVYVYSRSIDQYGNASDWTMQRIHLMSIDNIAVPESHSSYYDLTGRKVTHPTRGIYIKDGRKVIVHE